MLFSTASKTYRHGISFTFRHRLTRSTTGTNIYCPQPFSENNLSFFSPKTTFSISKRSLFDSAKVDKKETSEIFYEGPFAPMSLRLKFVSISSAIIGVFGVPTLIYMYSGDIPQAAQYALGGSTMFTACGSTVAVHAFFTPYVHTLEHVNIRQCRNNNGEKDIEEHSITNTANQEKLVKATWRNLFVIRQETVFDPAKDATPYKNGMRPFCNFSVNGIPFYVHPELIMDDVLRKHLLGDEVAKKFNMPGERVRENDEDELMR